MKGCTKPNCDCLEIAEQKADGPVKNYQCLYADLSDFAVNKGQVAKSATTRMEDLEEIKETAYRLSLFFDADGTPLDGFRLREEVVKLRDQIRAYDGRLCQLNNGIIKEWYNAQQRTEPRRVRRNGR